MYLLDNIVTHSTQVCLYIIQRRTVGGKGMGGDQGMGGEGDQGMGEGGDQGMGGGGDRGMGGG